MQIAAIGAAGAYEMSAGEETLWSYPSTTPSALRYRTLIIFFEVGSSINNRPFLFLLSLLPLCFSKNSNFVVTRSSEPHSRGHSSVLLVYQNAVAVSWSNILNI